MRRSLLQGEGLPFADALTAEQMPQAFDEEGSRSAGTITRRTSRQRAASADDDGIVYLGLFIDLPCLRQSVE